MNPLNPRNTRSGENHQVSRRVVWPKRPFRQITSGEEDAIASRNPFPVLKRVHDITEVIF
jgi:hypothetical protein